MMLPVSLRRQLQPGSFEYAINQLVDHCIDRSVFEERYLNDETGAPAIDPAILLKIVLFAYSRGILSSRSIARACEENVVFIALSADTRPHFTTIAHFISSMRSIEALVRRHREEDKKRLPSESREREERTIATLKKRAQKSISWTAQNEERMGRRGKPVKRSSKPWKLPYP
jgi:transposase